MLEDIRQLIETLLKVEVLHAGATTPGERGADEAAIERINKKLEQFAESDPPDEIQCRFSNHWSKQLFCALAKRYDIRLYRYYRQRHTTVMLRVPERFLNESLWPEFKGLDAILQNYLVQRILNGERVRCLADIQQNFFIVDSSIPLPYSIFPVGRAMVAVNRYFDELGGENFRKNTGNANDTLISPLA